MTKLSKSYGEAESQASPVVDVGKSGFFQDPYTHTDVTPQEVDLTTVAGLTEFMQSIHELNSRAEELFDGKEYTEALPYLHESYGRLTEFQYSPLSDEVMSPEEFLHWMVWVCYRIAFCYCEEKDYISAFYYIDLVKFLDATCFMEWINVLVNSRRMDAFGVVETYLEDSEELEALCRDESEVKRVRDFLERRLGYLYIEYRELEKAREIFTKLLDNPDSCRFAQEELEYIDGLV